MKKEQNYCGLCGQGLGFWLWTKNTSHDRMECTYNLLAQLRQVEKNIKNCDSYISTLWQRVIELEGKIK